MAERKVEPVVVAAGSSSGATTVTTADGSELRIQPLGSGAEVGRSAVLLEFKGKTVLFDCGVHPAYSGIASLPYFDTIDTSEIDLVLVTHFHLDHCAATPFLVEKTEFSGKVVMTHPTKAIYKMLLTDFVKVSNLAPEDLLFDEQDVVNSMEKIESIDYHAEHEHSGIRYWCYNAGHVLGAAMFMVDIAGVRVLYTGDFSRQEDRHLLGAETPHVSADVVIIESTYGVQIHEPRKDRESRFCTFVHDTVKRGGRCLLPVFALGRAQELLLILDEFWMAHPELHSIPVYYASSLARKTMFVYQTYINMMNERIQRRFEVSNPFVFKHISNLKSANDIKESGPCVVVASPGMLQSGLSRELFERWCSDEKNGVMLAGYSVEGTLAKHIMTQPKEIMRSDGLSVPLKCSIGYVTFSAHSDFLQTSEFVQELSPPHVVLVHGEKNEMGRLKQGLEQKFAGNMQVHVPANCETVRLHFEGDKIARVVGRLAESIPKEGAEVQGVIVRRNFRHTIMSISDIGRFTDLKTTEIDENEVVPFHLPFRTLHEYFSAELDPVETLETDGVSSLRVCKAITVANTSPGSYLTVSWQSSPENDFLADSVLSLIVRVEQCPPNIVRAPLRAAEDRSVGKDVFEAAARVLAETFDDVNADEDTQVIRVDVEGDVAEVYPETGTVQCGVAEKKQLVESLVVPVIDAVTPVKL